MEPINPINEQCLTPEEQQELRTHWTALQSALEPVGTRIEGTEDIDCDELYTMFLQLEDSFEEFEHVLMRTKQIRMLQSSRTDHTP